jgi:hypothetical protein
MSRRVEAEEELYKTRVKAFEDALYELEKYYSQRIVAEALKLRMPTPGQWTEQVLNANDIRTTQELEQLILRIKIECI